MQNLTTWQVGLYQSSLVAGHGASLVPKGFHSVRHDEFGKGEIRKERDREPLLLNAVSIALRVYQWKEIFSESMTH
jgi:hypothetical protein